MISDFGRRAAQVAARSRCQKPEKGRAIKMMNIEELRGQYSGLDDLVRALKDAWMEIEDADDTRVTGWREENGKSVFYTLTLRWARCRSKDRLIIKKIEMEVV